MVRLFFLESHVPSFPPSTKKGNVWGKGCFSAFNSKDLRIDSRGSHIFETAIIVLVRLIRYGTLYECQIALKQLHYNNS